MIFSTAPDTVARALQVGDALLLIDTAGPDKSIVLYVHSKVTPGTFKLTAFAAPRAYELPAGQAIPPFTAAIPLPASDIVYLVQQRSAADSTAIFSSYTKIAYEVGDQVVFMGEMLAGVDIDTVYYIRARPTANSFTLSLSNGGLEISMRYGSPPEAFGCMAVWSAYSTIIVGIQGGSSTLIAASPSTMGVGDAVQFSGTLLGGAGIQRRVLCAIQAYATLIHPHDNQGWQLAYYLECGRGCYGHG